MPKSKLFYKEYGELLNKTFIPESISSEEEITLSKSIIDLVKNNLPKKLFRYRTCNEYSIDAFRTNRIYSNSPNNFNDPHDGLIYIDINQIQNELNSFDKKCFLEIIKQVIETKKAPDFFDELLPPEIVKNLHNQSGEFIDDLRGKITSMLSLIKDASIYNFNALTEAIKNTVKISCFSEEIIRPIMWSYYADSHKGFALEYDFTNFKNKCENCLKNCDNYHLFPIVYADHRYNATDYAKFMLIHEEYSRFGYLLPKNKFTTNPDQLALRKICTYKAKCWKHEKEWRMMLRCSSSNKNKIHLECKPKAIYLGANISEIFKDILLKYAKENEIKAYKMDLQMNKQEFRMRYSQIKD